MGFECHTCKLRVFIQKSQTKGGQMYFSTEFANDKPDEKCQLSGKTLTKPSINSIKNKIL